MNLIPPKPRHKDSFSMNLTLVEITVGIPSFNEEANITNLLSIISEQKSELFRICEVIISDDSSDDTVRLVEEFSANNPQLNIKLLHHSSRRGVASAWNEIFRNAKGQVIVLFDADVTPGKDSIGELLSSLRGSAALCISNAWPMRSSTVAGRACHFISSWLRLVKKDRMSQYTTIGRGLLIRSDVASKIVIPEDTIAVDLFLQCKVLEFHKDIVYNDRSLVRFSPPRTIKDFNSQVLRSMVGHHQIENLVDRFNIWLPLEVAMRLAWRAFLSDPMGALAVITCYLLLPYHKSKLMGVDSNLWHVAKTTKITD